MNKRFFLFALLLYGCAVTAQTSISRAEYWIDTDPGRGEATALPLAGNTVSAGISTAGLSAGWHTIGLRAIGDGNSSQTYTRTFFVLSPEMADVEKVTGLEFFFDTDPGRGQATALPFTPDQTEFAISLLQMDTLPQGIHTIGLRVRKGPHWSETYTRTFLNTVIHSPMQVTDVEAYWDNDTTAIIALPFTQEEGYYAVNTPLSTEGLTEGTHTLTIRVKADEIYSIIQVFEVLNEEQPTAVDDTRDGQAPKTYKILRNGQIYILRMEKTYTVGGQEVK